MPRIRRPEMRERVRLAGDPAWTPPDHESVVMTELSCGDQIKIEPIAERPEMVSIRSTTRLEIIHVAKDSLRALSKLFEMAAKKWGQP